MTLSFISKAQYDSLLLLKNNKMISEIQSLHSILRIEIYSLILKEPEEVRAFFLRNFKLSFDSFTDTETKYSWWKKLIRLLFTYLIGMTILHLGHW